ncbi:baseplate J/gp47 family protein [Anaerosolibacter sp.]|uniref:baseplate J/gp47 family protein n=1 Tax=Anaerosolibacter sp. TaxID=1872527 RepID=UPI0039EF6293
MYGLTPQGFKRKTYEVIIQDMEARAKSLFGEKINLTERSPLGLFIRLVAWFLGNIWQLAEKVYNSAYVDSAEGVSLNYVGKYIGIKKKLKNKAKTSILATGDEGTLITPDNLIVATPGGIEFVPLETKAIGPEPTLISFECGVYGIIGNVPANSITEIITPLSGLASVTNPEKATEGQDDEKDEEFRARYDISVAKGGSSTTDSIRAKLLDEVVGVRAAIVLENDTMAVDADGIPPKSVHSIVLGGNEVDIANAILASKAGGIQAYGSTTVVVKDKSGRDKTIGFSYATSVLIYANVSITRTAVYPFDGDNQVKLTIIKYIGGTDAESIVYNGLSMNESVIYNRLIHEIYKIPGVKDVSLELSLDGITFTEGNISIGGSEVAETNSDIVVVTSHE